VSDTAAPATAPAALRPLPVTDDHDTGGFFAAAAQNELAIRMCNRCDAVLHMPVAYCRRCGSWFTRWQRVAGTGSLYSWTVVMHQVHPAFPAPYTVVLVQLDDHPEARLVGSLPGRPDMRVGQAMEVWFDAVSDEVVLPQWRPAATDRDSADGPAPHGGPSKQD
jgi:uncharacterized OB-fold protein